MIGKIFITRHGYDPGAGKIIKDPYLGDTPSIGACRPDFRKQLSPGDHIFVISGKVPGLNQFVMGGFEIDKKMPMKDAYQLYPEQRLALTNDGQLKGNIIMDSEGKQHELDNHNKFDQRVDNYVVGKNPVTLKSESEIELGRDQTMEVLCDIFKPANRTPKIPRDVIGRARNVDGKQINELRNWLSSIKHGTSHEVFEYRKSNSL